MKKNIKKITWMAGFVFAAALALTGCGKKTAEQEAEEAVQSAFEELDKELEKVAEEIGDLADEKESTVSEEKEQEGAIVVDAFDEAFFDKEDGVKIGYDGIAPDGYFYVNNQLPQDNPASVVRYHMEGDNSDNLAHSLAGEEQRLFREGDTLIVTASIPREYENKGYVLKEETCEYTVKNIDHYLTDVAEIEGAKSQIFEEILSAFAAEDYLWVSDGSLDWSPTGAKNAREGGIHLLKNKKGYFEREFLVSVRATLENSETNSESDEMQGFYSVGGLYMNKDGEVCFDKDYYSFHGFYGSEESAYEDIISSYYYEDYTIETVS